MAKKINPILIIIIILALGFFAYKIGIFNLFTLQPIIIDPKTCVPGELLSEKSILSNEVSSPCYPYDQRYPVIIVAYSGKSGNYISTISGSNSLWGAENGISTLIRCYKCSSAQILSGSPTTKVLTDDIISNPLRQSNALSSVCVIGQCTSGWECKSSSGGSYYEYTACEGAPANPVRFCGNGVLENGETQDNCCKDAGCPTDYSCQSNSCIKDENPPQPPTPENCGDGVCGTGENQSNCCTDCKCPASQQCISNSCEQTSFNCGNYICDQGETCESCPIDCQSCECGPEGTILYEQCDIGFRDNQWAIKQCLNRKWSDVESGISCFCANNNVCKSGYTCQSNICLPDLPKFCTTTADCGSLREFYCDSSTHSCLKCPEYGGPSECIFSQYSCLSSNDCFSIPNQNYCDAWNCVGNRCIESGKRYDNCCNNVSDCSTDKNYTCEGNSCKEVLPPAPKKVSLVNLLITLGIILLVGVGGFFAYNKWFKNK